MTKKIIISIICVLLAGVFGFGVFAAVKQGYITTTPASVKSETNTTKTDTASLEKIAELNKQISDYAKQVASLNSYISELEQSEEDNEAVIDGLREVVTNKTNQIETLQGQLVILQEEYDQLQAQYNDLQDDYTELQTAYSTAQLDTQTLIGLYDGSVTSITVPEGVTTIRPYAFAGLTLNSLTLPTTITNIGDFAFIKATINSFSCIASGDLRLNDSVFSSAVIDDFTIDVAGHLIVSSFSMQGINTIKNISITYNTCNSNSLCVKYSGKSFETCTITSKSSPLYVNGDWKGDENSIFTINSPNINGLNILDYLKGVIVFNLNGNVGFSQACYLKDCKKFIFNNLSGVRSYFSAFQLNPSTNDFDYDIELNGIFFGCSLLSVSGVINSVTITVDCEDSLVLNTSNISFLNATIINTSNSYWTKLGCFNWLTITSLYVNDDLYDQYIADTNYVDYVSKIHKLSDLNTEATE